MKTRFLLGLGVLLAGYSTAVAQNSVPGYPNVKVVPVDTSSATKHDGGEDIQHQLSANLTGAGYTNVKIRPDGFIVEATNKAGEPVVMFLTPDSATVYTALDAKGQDSRTTPSASPPTAATR
jgi:hypothetical protein